MNKKQTVLYFLDFNVTETATHRSMTFRSRETPNNMYFVDSGEARKMLKSETRLIHCYKDNLTCCGAYLHTSGTQDGNVRQEDLFYSTSQHGKLH